MSERVLSFAAHVLPLFREDDREAMESYFDLWSYEAVVENDESILQRLEDESMPCDDPWPQEQIDIFRSWMEGGHLP